METFIEFDSEADAPVSLEEVKAHLTIEHDDDDTRLQALVDTAIELTEHETNITARPQTWQLILPCFPAKLWLSRPPLDTVDSVVYFDEDNEEQTLSEDAFYLLKGQRTSSLLQPVECWPATYVRPDAVTVTYTTAANADTKFKLAVCLLVAAWNEDREGKGDIPDGVARLWNAMRCNRGTL